ncbi:PREDICTED: uncharacterized protein LOC106116424 [Papilio xuthus]|uniref:Uncharacterized protein LOC106116424 n=1 Tax=Papilio xuthus TaxID=66420 RepID=A0AAJ6Z5E5_PAPXU|nr:PREDICTED: uncharacterized protein LOC106116424 [Papilio xuthus]
MLIIILTALYHLVPISESQVPTLSGLGAEYNKTGLVEETCGIDNSGLEEVQEGSSFIETYPWFGVIVFPLEGLITSSPVVLITKQLVIGAAIEIANLPKVDFRARTKVILGTNCKGRRHSVVEYSYHPDFQKNTYSSLVLIQIEPNFEVELRPICPPPSMINKPDFYAFSLAEDCMLSAVEIYKMSYVDTKECKSYYRRTGLNVKSIWPKYTVCAKAQRGGECLWQSGVFLVTKHKKRWKLIGFGVYGPGCSSPARFLDYGMYHQWIRTNIQRIGRPAITRLAGNHIVMRRRLTSVQRFGPCDPEETKVEIYTDHSSIQPVSAKPRNAYYNFTILAGYEYSCIVFRANQEIGEEPTIHLKRMCIAKHIACYQFTTLQIDFEVTIGYFDKVEYHINVYGIELKLLDAKRMNVLANRRHYHPPIDKTYTPYIYSGWGIG